MDEMTLQRSLHDRPPADPVYRPRLTSQPGFVAVTEATTRTTRATRGTRPMLTATRLVAAIAIVSLSAGALLFSAVGIPSPTPVPSPSPSPSDVSLVTETVAPGVEHVLGLRSGSSPDSPWLARFDQPDDTSLNHTGVALDGTVWMLETGHLLRLDEPEQWPRDGVGRPDKPVMVPGFRDDIQVAANGTVFVSSWPIQSFDGTGWTTEWDGTLFSGQADGAIWAYAGGMVARWEDGDWTEWSVPGVCSCGPIPFVATPEGVVWFGRVDPERPTETLLARFDGTALTNVSVPGVPDDVSPTLIAAGVDGTLWVYLQSKELTGYLARLTPDGWTVFGTDDGVPVVNDLYYAGPGFMAVDGDGRVWLTREGKPQDGCGGVASFDSAVWTTYLEDTCIVDLDVAPGGTVWVQTALREPGQERAVAGPTYRITPGG